MGKTASERVAETKTQIAAPRVINKPGVCGGDPIIAGTRIPVWWLECARRRGMTQARLLRDFPKLCQEDLLAAWDYVQTHELEIEKQIIENTEE